MSFWGWGLRLGGRRGGGVAPWVADIYVDSVAGDDANAGTLAEPLQTLGAVQAVAGVDDAIAFVRGSTWLEQLNFFSTTGVTVTAVGTGALPIVRGDTGILASEWVSEGGDVYSFTFTLPSTLGADPSLRVYRGGAILSRVANVVNLVSDQQYHVPTITTGDAGSSAKVSIFASTAPTTEPDETYTVTRRDLGVYTNGNVSGVEAWRQIHGGGAIKSQAGLVKNCLAVDGNKHNIYHAEGIAENCIAWRAQGETSSGSSTLFVGFQVVPTNKTIGWRECIAFGGPESLNNVAYFGHGGVETFYDTVIYEGVWAIDCHGFGLVEAPNNIFRKSPSGVWNYQKGVRTTGLGRNNISAKNVLINNFNNTGDRIHQFTNINFGTGGAIDDVAIAVLGNDAAVVNIMSGAAAAYTVRNSVFWGTRESGASSLRYTQEGTISVRNSVLASDAAGINQTNASGDIVNTDYNVYMTWVSAINGRMAHKGTMYNVPASYLSASGQDANSVFLVRTEQVRGSADAFWLGVANDENDGPVDGDFRINPTCKVRTMASSAIKTGVFADDTPIVGNCGLTEAITSWPTIPTTVDQARAVIEDRWVP